MAKDTNKAPKEVKKNSKDKRHFMKDFRAELKKVVWPTPKQLLNNTVAVITIVLATTVIVFVLDICFEFMNKYGIDNVKKLVENQSSNSVQDENTVNDIDTNNVEDTNTTENVTNEVE